MDLFQLGNKTHFLAIDYYSKYPESAKEIKPFLTWTVIATVKRGLFPLRKKYFLPFHFGKIWKKHQNLTNTNIFFMLFIHICNLKKNNRM